MSPNSSPDDTHVGDPGEAQREHAIMRLFAVAECLQIARGHNGWSIETAAKEAKIGHMTWRRVEDGDKVRPKTYAALDKLFGLPPGSVVRATNDDGALVAFADAVGVDTRAIEQDLSPALFVAGLGRSRMESSLANRSYALAGPAAAAPLGGLTATVGGPVRAPKPTVVLVTELLARLAQEERSPAAEDALGALHRLLPELFGPATGAAMKAADAELQRRDRDA